MSQYDYIPYYLGLSIIIASGLFFLLTLLLMLTKNACISVFYGLFLMIFTLVAFTAGGLFMWAKFYVPDLINSNCVNPDSNIHYVDTAYEYANMAVCSPECICDANYTYYSDAGPTHPFIGFDPSGVNQF